MRIVAISGSLRPDSSNTAVLRALATLAPPDVSVTLYDGLGDLPHFSPERDVEPAPPAVQALRTLLTEADAVAICTPEYAHGMPGTLKNALEWVVGSGEMVDKPVAALSASPSTDGGANARAWLVQTLTVMSVKIIPEASFEIGMVRAKFAKDGTLSDPATITQLKNVLAALKNALISL